MRYIPYILLSIMIYATQVVATTRQIDFAKLVDQRTYYGVYVGEQKVGYAFFSRLIKGEKQSSVLLDESYIYLQCL